LVRTGVIDPTQILPQAEPLSSAIEAYGEFDLRHVGGALTTSSLLSR
jgi:hypothetical protein